MDGDDMTPDGRLAYHVRNIVLEALDRLDGNRTRVAAELGVSARWLQMRIRDYRGMGIKVPDCREPHMYGARARQKSGNK